MSAIYILEEEDPVFGICQKAGAKLVAWSQRASVVRAARENFIVLSNECVQVFASGQKIVSGRIRSVCTLESACDAIVVRGAHRSCESFLPAASRCAVARRTQSMSVSLVTCSHLFLGW